MANKYTATFTCDRALWSKFKKWAHANNSSASEQLSNFMKTVLIDDVPEERKSYIDSVIEERIQAFIDDRLKDLIDQRFHHQASVLVSEYKNFPETTKNISFGDTDNTDDTDNLDALVGAITYDTDDTEDTDTLIETISKNIEDIYKGDQDTDDTDNTDTLVETISKNTEDIYKGDQDTDDTDNTDSETIENSLSGKLLLSDLELKRREQLKQHPTTIGRWRKDRSKIPFELIPIFAKYEIIGTRWAKDCSD